MMRLNRERELMAQKILNLTSQSHSSFPPMVGQSTNIINQAPIMSTVGNVSSILGFVPLSNVSASGVSSIPHVTNVSAQAIINSASTS